MKTPALCFSVFVLFTAGLLPGCSNTTAQSPDVSANIRSSLDQAGLKDVSVSQDREKGVVTLAGHTPSESNKSEAESLAKAGSGGQVVANQIAVLPPGNEKDAKDVNSDLDAGIEKNLDAALIKSKLQKIVKYDVKNGVVTLTGEVVSEATRGQAEQIATGVPNVKQVVNDLQTKNQKAT